jgi:hypothetical protein
MATTYVKVTVVTPLVTTIKAIVRVEVMLPIAKGAVAKFRPGMIPLGVAPVVIIAATPVVPAALVVILAATLAGIGLARLNVREP